MHSNTTVVVLKKEILLKIGKNYSELYHNGHVSLGLYQIAQFVRNFGRCNSGLVMCVVG